MTTAARVRVTPRLWAVAALAALVLLAAGLVQVVLGSREELLQLLVSTVLSLAVVAATAWWAFTTRRVWKRWLNIAIATLAVASVLLGFVEFGYRQAAGALAIVAGALLYATAARHALRSPGPPGPVAGPWTTADPRSGSGLRSPTGGPDQGGWGSGGAPEAQVFRTGDDVTHASLGDGVVIGTEPGGIVVVRFAEDGRERKLMADYAPVRKR